MGFLRTLPDGSAEYAGGGHRVTVQSDGAIQVKPGDWLSKYSMAIFGDFNPALIPRRFGKRYGGQVKPFSDIPGADVNLIRVGETVYLMNRYNTQNGSNGEEEMIVPPRGGKPVPKTSVDSWLTGFMKYWQSVVWPFTNWEVVPFTALGLGAGLLAEVSGSRVTYFAQRKGVDPKPIKMTGTFLGVGGPFSPPISVSISTPHNTGEAYLLKGPSAGATLSPSELSGAALCLEIGGKFCWGGSASVILCGPSVTEAFYTSLQRTTFSAAQLLSAKWALFTAGTLWGVPEAGINASIGYMYSA